MARQLLVESIRIDGDTQCRVRINEETVTEYAEAMQAPAGSGPPVAWPPILVFYDGTEFWLADGFHRLLAVKRIGRKNIAATVKDGSREDAAWAACGANQTHGLRRTHADKRKSVEMALRLRPTMSDRVIAEHCGVSQNLPGSVRRRCHLMTPEDGKRIGADGKSYRLPESRRCRKRTSEGDEGGDDGDEANPPRESVGGDGFGPPPPAKRGGEAASASAGAPPPVERPPAKPGGPVDGVGRLIPENVQGLWDRGDEVRELLNAISRVRVTLRKAQEVNDPLYSAISFSGTLVHLDQAYALIKSAVPYAVCACCQGHGCRTCKGRGILGKFEWDTGLPRELKEAVAKLVEKEQAAG